MIAIIEININNKFEKLVDLQVEVKNNLKRTRKSEGKGA